MAKPKHPAGTPASFQLNAQREVVRDLQIRVKEIQHQLDATLNRARVARDGFDKYAAGVTAAQLVALQASTVAPENQAAHDAIIAKVGPLQSALKVAQSELSAARDVISELERQHQAEHAPQLLEQAAANHGEALANERACKAKISSLQQRKAAATQAVAARAAAQLAHDQAAAAALAAGEDVPPAPELGNVAETPEQLAAAIKLVNVELDQLAAATRAAESKVQHYRGVIARKQLDGFMTELVNQAADVGVSLKDVRDGLIEQIGNNWMAAADAAEAHALRSEVAALKPECDSLRARVKLLELAVQSAAQHGSQQGRSAQASFNH